MPPFSLQSHLTIAISSTAVLGDLQIWVKKTQAPLCRPPSYDQHNLMIGSLLDKSSTERVQISPLLCRKDSVKAPAPVPQT